MQALGYALMLLAMLAFVLIVVGGCMATIDDTMQPTTQSTSNVNSGIQINIGSFSNINSTDVLAGALILCALGTFGLVVFIAWANSTSQS